MKNFLKIETSVKQGDPRNISPRSDEFLVSIGPYIAALEHVYAKADFLVKGCNIKQRDGKLSGMLSYRTYLILDYTRYDQSLDEMLLRFVEFVFLAMPFADDLFFRILAMAWLTRGVSDLGTFYLIMGTRCSGDAHTSIGNGLIGKFVLWLCIQFIIHFSLHEGDDGAAALHKRDLSQALYNLGFLNCLGLTVKVDICHELMETSFCGRMLYAVGPCIQTYCDLKRTLAKYHTICSEGAPIPLLVAKSMSYYYTDRDTPLIGTLAYVIIKLYRHQLTDRQISRAWRRLNSDLYTADKIRGFNYLACKYELIAPSAGVRAAVAFTTGYSPGMQVAFENYYLSFIELGYLPHTINRIPEGWTLDVDAHIYANISNWVA